MEPPSDPSMATASAAAPLDGCEIELDADSDFLAPGVLAGGTPLRLLRLSGEGLEALELLRGGEAAAGGHPTGQLARLLVDSGCAHPRWAGAAPSLDALTAVIPIKDRVDELDLVLGDLAGLSVIVIDDHSDDGEAVAEVALRHGADTIRLEKPGGPGAARNAGARLVTTPLTLFLDSDCRASIDEIAMLAKHFADPTVAAVAPRIRGPVGRTLRDSFEHDASPLDMGPRPAAVRPGSRVSYVPSAALIVRTELAEGLFDERLVAGEDVDAVWRLTELGWSVRYDPTVHVAHPARTTWGAWLAQRYSYGRTAAALEEIHGDAAAPLRGSPWALGGWALIACGRPMTGASVLFGGVKDLTARLDGVVDDPESAAWHLTARQAWRSGPVVARQILRSYAPILVLGSVLSKRMRVATVATVAVAGLGRWRRAEATLDPVLFTALSTLDDLAYCAGVWHGAIQTRRSGALRPRIVNGGQGGSAKGSPRPRVLTERSRPSLER